MKTYFVIIAKPTGMQGIQIIDVAEITPEEIDTYLLEKFFISSCDSIYIAEINSEELDKYTYANLQKYKSKLNDSFYQLEFKSAVELIADTYHENYYCSDSSIDDIVIKIIQKKEKQNLEHIEYEHKVQQFANTYQSQYDDLNKIWENHWIEKSKILVHFLKNNIYPERRRGIFVNETKAYREFSDATDAYSQKLRSLIEDWRDSTKFLPYHIEVSCPKCNNKFKLSANGLGPGSKGTYGGDNWNTDTSRDLLLKKEYGKKLLNGRKYWWRSFSELVGKCNNPDCDFLKNSIIFRPPFKNSDSFSIYPYDDKKSWFEYVGVWGTMSEWLAYKLEYYDYDSFHSLFKKYFDNNRQR